MKKLWTVLALVTMLAACSKDEVPLAPQSTPSLAAVNFFDALYNQRDLAVAEDFATGEAKELLEHYGSVSSVQRYVMSQYYDDVHLEVDESSVQPFQDSGDRTQLTMMFDGYHNGDRIEEIREIVLIEYKGKWYVQKILDKRYH